MFSCKDVTEHASAYVSGEMSLWTRAQYRLHLFICHDCRNFVAQFRATIGALRGRKKSVATTTIDSQVAALLRAQREEQLK